MPLGEISSRSVWVSFRKVGNTLVVFVSLA